MRILHLKLCNLNSLRDVWEIDFEAAPLGNAGLFAIVGDTGAGKTTLLDAITLALYGKIHRNNDPKESLSYNAVDALAEVTFRVGANEYVASWSIRRARGKVDGALQNVKHTLRLVDLKSDEVLDTLGEGTRETVAAVEEVTGLNFDRFSRSILLAQGDFAAFLKAKVEERSELLEQITGTEIYSSISKAAHERNKLELAELEKLQAEQKGLALLSEEELEENTATQEALRSQTRNINTRIGELQKGIQHWIDLAKTREGLHTTQAALDALLQQKEQMDAKEHKLIRHRKALPLQIDLENRKRLDKTLSTDKAKHAGLEKSLEENTAKAQENKQLLQLSKAELEVEEQRKEALFELFDSVLKLDQQMAQETMQLAKIRTLHQDQLQEQELLKAQELQLEKDAGAAQNESDLLQQWLEENQHGADLKLLAELRHSWNTQERHNTSEQQLKTERQRLGVARETIHGALANKRKALEASEQQYAALQQQFNDLRPPHLPASAGELLEYLQEELAQLKLEKEQEALRADKLTQYQQLLWEYSETDAKRRELLSAEYVLSNELLEALEQADRAEIAYQTRRKIHEREQLVANYEKDRAALAAGEECPLCLSTEHPFRTRELQTFEDSTRNDLEQAEKARDAAQKTLRALGQQQQRLFLELQQLSDDKGQGLLQKLELKIRQLEQGIAALPGASRSMPPSEEALAQRASQLTSLRELNKKLEGLGEQIRETRYEGDMLQQQLDGHEQNLKRIDSELAGLQTEVEASDKQLRALLTSLGYAGHSISEIPTLLRKLQDLEVLYAANQQKFTDAQSSLKLLTQKRGSVKELQIKQQGQIYATTEQLRDAEQHLAALAAQRKTSFEDRQPEAERSKFMAVLQGLSESCFKSERLQDRLEQEAMRLQKDVSEVKQQIQENTVALRELDSRLQEKLRQSDFDSLLQVEETLVSESEAENLEREVHRFKEQHSLMIDRKTNFEEMLATQQAAAEKAAPQNAMESELTELQQQRDNRQQQLGALQEARNQHDRRAAASQKLLEKIEKQRAQSNAWAGLNKLIGSHDGKKFRAFAQGLTLQNLINLANQHLANLHGRYLIRKQEGEDLELHVVDTYQADHSRSMNTLSGGESFLVSLALALGLSDLASGHTRIESLFIDEGFGTLDEENLELALSTLENLQASGKSIGIISHVRELKERVSVQIRVTKRGNGNSGVQIIENPGRP